MTRIGMRPWFGLLLLPIFGAAVGCLWVHSPSQFNFLDRAPHVDDASRLNRTRVAEVVAIPANPAAAEAQLRELLKGARANKLKISIAGARHSMGGHTIAPDGIVLDMLPFNRLELDAAKSILRAGAGARWSEIIPFLDARGFSIGVMQSDNDFSVGGSISVNCHGWPVNRPPICSTVESLTLMKASGDVVRCSRHENAELFSLVLGGYGLFGVILDVELRVVPNQRYRADSEVVAIENYAERFAAKVGTADDIMAYGRLCVAPTEKAYLRDAVLTVFAPAPCVKEQIPKLSGASMPILRREVFRAQVGNNPAKALRWRLEKGLGEQFQDEYFSRNRLLNESAATYLEIALDRTDVIHEYFVPIQNVAAFVERVRGVVPKHRGADLLNVTIRHVREDKDTFLRYADQEMFAFVMLFNYARTPAADAEMAALTRDLVDASLDSGGRYYLPYRLHATSEQFLKAYPQAQKFFEQKRRLDPDGIFQNQFYLHHGLPKS